MSRNHSPSLEGARGVAALSVLAYHSVWFSEHRGLLGAATARLWLGVPLFFLLSGFLLFRPMAHAAIFQERRPSFARYARSRVLRIVPAYWVALTVTVIALYPRVDPVAIGAIALLLLARYLWTGRGLLISLLIAGTALCALITTPTQTIQFGLMNYGFVFLLFRENGMIGPAWTLCIEVAFYVFLPFFVLAAELWARRGPTVKDRASRLAVLLTCLLPVGNMYLTFSGDGHAMPTWLPGYLDQFAIGMLLAVAVEVWPTVSVRRGRELLALALLTGVVVNVGAYHLGAPSPYGNGSAGLYGPGMDVAFALALASVLMRGEQNALGRILSWRPLVIAGTLSYGIYLWHMFVIVQLQGTALWWSSWTNVLLVFTGAVLLAGASWIVIERPALRLRDQPPAISRLFRRQPAAAPIDTVPTLSTVRPG